MTARLLIAVAACLALGPAGATEVEARLSRSMAEFAEAGKAHAEALAVQVQSTLSPQGAVSSEARGTVEAPYAHVVAALSDHGRWCELLLLHLNNKACHLTPGTSQPTLSLKIVRRFDLPPERGNEINFRFRPTTASAQAFSTQLTAAEGPFGTSDHQIDVDVAPVSQGRTFVRLSYGYQQSAVTAAATRFYFATFARNKIGFSVTQRHADGTPEYVGGIRGLVERNVMRYFLALQAYVSSDRPLKRATHWFELTEQHPRQLHETTLDEYLASRQLK